jgi:membrane protease YdiL (CAAX protease family)
VDVLQLFSDISVAEYLFWAMALGAMVLHLYPGSAEFFRKRLPTTLDPREHRWWTYHCHHLATLVIFTLPLLLMGVAGISTGGGQLFLPGDWQTGALWTVIGCAVATVPTWLQNRDPEFLAEYPLSMAAFDSPRRFSIFTGSYLLYYIGWESFFRGFIGFGMIGLGYSAFLALMVQVSLSTIIHIGKPRMELLGAIPGGIFMGLLAYATGSLIWPILFHLWVGMVNTVACGKKQ